MAINPEPRKMSVEEFLALDESSDRYEYIDGYALAMSGENLGHARLTSNLMFELDRRFRAETCEYEVFNSSIKAFIPERGNYFASNISVTCDARDTHMDNDVIRFPSLIAEVVSSATEARDRGYKFLCYQTLPSLQEYVLVDSRYQLVEIFRRQPDEAWIYQLYKPDQIVEFKCLDIQLTFAEIYKNVSIPAKFDLVKELQEKYSVS